VKIAFEKGGIFKPGVPVVLGQLRPSAEKELRRIAREKKTGAVKNIVRRFGNDSQKWPRSALKGAYQRKNAATALLILESLKTRFPKLNDGGIAKGFQSVRWDGRWQEFLLQDKRTLILEGAHNPEAAQLLQQELSALRKKGKRIAAVMGACGLSRAHAVLEALAAHADSITLVKVAQPRGCTVEQLGEILKKLNYRGQVAHADVSALFPRPAAAAFGAATDTLLVTGSLYLVGEVLERLRPRASDARGELGFHDLI